MRRAASWSAGSSGSCGSGTVRLRLSPRRMSSPASATQLVDDEAVAEQQVVRRDESGDALLPSGCVVPCGVAQERGAEGLVEGRPGRHPVAEDVVDGEGVVGEAVGGVAVGPPARVLQRLREVPVVERQPGRDVVGEQLVDESVVEGETGPVDRPAVGSHARPGHGEAVGRDLELAHQGDVLGHPVVVLARDVAGVRVEDRARGVGEGVPDRGRAAVLGHGSLDLVGRGGDPPDEALGEPEPAPGSVSGLVSVRWMVIP